MSMGIAINNDWNAVYEAPAPAADFSSIEMSHQSSSKYVIYNETDFKTY